MPTFDTPAAISATVDLVVGDVRITATDRTDTVVEIRPSNASTEADVRAAEQTRVDYTDGRLTVRAPRQRGFGLFGKPGSVDVTIEVPTGSHLHGDASVAAFHGTGRLGSCRLRTAAGDIELDRAADVDLDTSAGAVRVEHVAGRARISTGTGRIRVQEVQGDAEVKNTNGDSWLGSVTGEARVKAANGDIAVDRAHATVTATTVNGDVRIGEVSAGTTTVRTQSGRLDVGVRSGTPVLLDLHTQFGRVENHLDAYEPSGEPAGGVRVSARTSFGDIVIRRC
ncbi:DUF4097 family beta strand repeat protein [Micromonospora sp. C31]|uniref:DUF4097 family beta strand repeat-containing protein n=1 Tax=Micromonospora sp. C31 TaxID=2824876 RepID=UPI001B38AE4A|nr:DUF4097 family beta strand repeat-containing protein [Micromonospora sp. C31]MBQ1072930.1 DUF4097 family beta strand repeat protein [Micromonospora sp. C31]